MIDRTEDQVAALLRRLPPFRGKRRVAWAWQRIRERRPLAGEWTVGLTNGATVALPRGSHMAWAVAVSGAYDELEVGLVSELARPGTVVLDVGASLGLWTVQLATAAARAGAQVVAVEPHPANLPWLERNLRRNGPSADVVAHPVALGAEHGTATMRLDDPGGGNAAIDPAGAGESSVVVPMRTLDELLGERRVSVMKLDVEGFELEVLRGATRTLARDRPAIFGEFSPEWLADRNEDLAGFLASPALAGYRAHRVARSRSVSWREADRLDVSPWEPGERYDHLLLLPGS
jgi:FkbM family methyltransferase